MEITTRSVWTFVHGMGFGALYLLACSGALAELYSRFAGRTEPLASGGSPFLKVYLILMSLFAWLAVLSGTYVIYPWYRATPTASTADLSGFPQKLLMSQPPQSDGIRSEWNGKSTLHGSFPSRSPWPLPWCHAMAAICGIIPSCGQQSSALLSSLSSPPQSLAFGEQ